LDAVETMLLAIPFKIWNIPAIRINSSTLLGLIEFSILLCSTLYSATNPTGFRDGPKRQRKILRELKKKIPQLAMVAVYHSQCGCETQGLAQNI
jgi:hypothetical protein